MAGRAVNPQHLDEVKYLEGQKVPQLVDALVRAALETRPSDINAFVATWAAGRLPPTLARRMTIRSKAPPGAATQPPLGLRYDDGIATVQSNYRTQDTTGVDRCTYEMLMQAVEAVCTERGVPLPALLEALDAHMTEVDPRDWYNDVQKMQAAIMFLYSSELYNDDKPPVWMQRTPRQPLQAARSAALERLYRRACRPIAPVPETLSLDGATDDEIVAAIRDAARALEAANVPKPAFGNSVPQSFDDIGRDDLLAILEGLASWESLDDGSEDVFASLRPGHHLVADANATQKCVSVVRVAYPAKTQFRDAMQACAAAGKWSAPERLLHLALQDAITYLRKPETTVYKVATMNFDAATNFVPGRIVHFPTHALATKSQPECQDIVAALPDPAQSFVLQMKSNTAAPTTHSMFPRRAEVILPAGTTWHVQENQALGDAEDSSSADPFTTVALLEVDRARALHVMLKRTLKDAPTEASTSVLWELIRRRRVLHLKPSRPMEMTDKWSLLMDGSESLLSDVVQIYKFTQTEEDWNTYRTTAGATTNPEPFAFTCDGADGACTGSPTLTMGVDTLLGKFIDAQGVERNCSLKPYEEEGGDFTDVDAEFLKELLHLNPTAEIIDGRRTSITDDGAELLIQGLCSNTVVREVLLDDSKVGQPMRTATKVISMCDRSNGCVTVSDEAVRTPDDAEGLSLALGSTTASLYTVWLQPHVSEAATTALFTSAHRWKHVKEVVVTASELWTQATWDALADAVVRRQIPDLVLSTSVVDTCAAGALVVIVQCPTLRTFDLSGSVLSQPAQDALFGALGTAQGVQTLILSGIILGAPLPQNFVDAVQSNSSLHSVGIDEESDVSLPEWADKILLKMQRNMLAQAVISQNEHDAAVAQLRLYASGEMDMASSGKEFHVLAGSGRNYSVASNPN